MSNPNYTLEVISHHPQFKDKTLRKYYVEGIETVGAWGDEPFEIKFTNHTWNKVQVKISLDGTDIFTGEPATTEATKDMWVVQGYGTLSLKAWPETNNGGAAFIFTSGSNSVALHTHGDMSNRGIIAAAVFTEGHVEPIVNNYYPYYGLYYYPYWTYPYYPNFTLTGGTIINGSYGGTYGTLGQTTVSNNIGLQGTNTCSFNGSVGSSIGGGGTYSVSNISGQVTMDSSLSEQSSYQNLVAVGAGEHVDQHISYTAGLIKPLFAESVRVRYLWWDDLVTKLKEFNVPAPHASGFPGDTKHTNIDLKSTPRKLGVVKRHVPVSAPVYVRV